MKGLVLIIAVVVAVVAFNSVMPDEYSDIRQLARAEAVSKKDTVGVGDCRVVNTLAALGLKNSRIVYGTIKDGRGEYRHLWALDQHGAIVDKSCPPSDPACVVRGYRAIVRTSDLAVLWTAPGDSSWRESHVYVTEFISSLRKGESR